MITMYRSIREASKALRAKVDVSKTKGSLQDYDKLILCEMMGNWTPMFTTKLYIKYSPEYCVALEHVHSIANAVTQGTGISKYMELDMLEAYFTVGGRVPAYGGKIDTVISFRTEAPIFGWAVEVEDEEGRRFHSTKPGKVGGLLERRGLN
jgi:hypothetical protein